MEIVQTSETIPLSLMRAGHEILRVTAGGDVFVVMEDGTLFPIDGDALLKVLLDTRAQRKPEPR